MPGHLKRREALWTFIQVAGVESTDNPARGIDPSGGLWRKGSFGTQGLALCRKHDDGGDTLP
jgi:hypothetical protein